MPAKTKIIFKVLALAIFLTPFSPSMAQVPEMVEGWPYKTITGGLAVSAVPRFSMGESISSSAIFYNDNAWRALKFYFDGSFYSGWPVVFGDNLAFGGSIPILADLDHDGNDEMVTLGTGLGSPYDSLVVIDDNGVAMPGFPIGLRIIRGLSIADFDNDNDYEIFVYSNIEGFAYCYGRFGDMKPGWPISIPDDRFYGGEAVGDMDLDGTNEIIIHGNDHIYAYRYDGSQAPNFPFVIPDTSYMYFNGGYPPSLVDIDNDGFLEILTSWDNWETSFPYFASFVAIYEHTGEIKSGWPVSYNDLMIGAPPVPSDINNDGTIEMGFSYGQYTTFLDINTNPLPGWPTIFYTPEGYMRGPQCDMVLVDLDGDRDLEIFTDFNIFYPDSMVDSQYVYGYSWLFAVDHTAQPLSGYPIQTNGDYFRKPSSFYYDEESSHLYMGMATDGAVPDYIDTLFLEIYRFPDSTGPPNQWPMLSHDNLMTRNYNFVDNVSAIHSGEPILPQNYVLKQNYPNPFNSSTVIEFDIPREEVVNLFIYDVLGRKVAEPLNERLMPGQYSQKIDLKNLSSGVYFYILKTEQTQICRKMILMK